MAKKSKKSKKSNREHVRAFVRFITPSGALSQEGVSLTAAQYRELTAALDSAIGARKARKEKK